MFQHRFLKRLSFPHWITLVPLATISWPPMCRCTLGLYSVGLVSLFILISGPRLDGWETSWCRAKPCTRWEGNAPCPGCSDHLPCPHGATFPSLPPTAAFAGCPQMGAIHPGPWKAASLPHKFMTLWVSKSASLPLSQSFTYWFSASPALFSLSILHQHPVGRAT